MKEGSGEGPLPVHPDLLRLDLKVLPKSQDGRYSPAEDLLYTVVPSCERQGPEGPQAPREDRPVASPACSDRREPARFRSSSGRRSA